jgi:hypothetical protein
MDRRDILWIAFKLAGLYLITEGVLWIPEAVVDGEIGPQLSAGVPLLCGLILLAVRVPPGVGAAFTLPPLSMSRQDWFWLVCKTLGVWSAIRALMQLPTTIQYFFKDYMDWVQVLTVVVYLAAGLLLIFTDAVPAAVERLGRPVDDSARKSDGRAAAQDNAADDAAHRS